MNTFFMQGNHATNLEGPKYEISANKLTFLEVMGSNAIGVCYAKTVNDFYSMVHLCTDKWLQIE